MKQRQMFGRNLCESTLTTINRSQRLSTSHQRTSHLVLLAFEQKWTERINSEHDHKLKQKTDRIIELY